MQLTASTLDRHCVILNLSVKCSGYVYLFSQKINENKNQCWDRAKIRCTKSLCCHKIRGKV